MDLPSRAMNNADIPTSYGGIVIPWRGADTCEMVLTTVRGENGALYHALPKGKPKRNESGLDAAKRETAEETGIRIGRLHPLLKAPITEYIRQTGAGQDKRIMLWAIVTDDRGPYAPKNATKHPLAEAVPLHRAAEFLHNPDDAMQIVRLQTMLHEMVTRMKGIFTWNGIFEKHPDLAKELEKNMKKFRRSLAR